MNYLKAKYQDGFILDEQKQNDVSLFDKKRNTFYDILNNLCEPEHGKLVELTLVLPDKISTIDWTTVPDNAKPIRYRTFEMNLNTGEQSLLKTGFGYEYLKDGKNVQKIEEII